ncbi:hypothetical protein GCM10018966_012400 [Streptomyces yanii]
MLVFFLLDLAHPVWWLLGPFAVLLLAGACFGIPQGLIGTSNQAAVRTHAPPEAIGSAAGLQRIAQYIGAITASSLIALAYGQSPSDGGLHLMAAVSAVLGLLLIVLTVTDRALRICNRPPPERTEQGAPP